MLLSALTVWLTIRDFLIAGDGYLFDVFTIRFRIDNGDDVADFLYLFLYIWLLLMLAAIFWHV